MCLTSLQVWAADGNKPLYKDAKAPVERRVEDLLSRMSLEEKVYQLNQYTLGSNNNINNIGEAVKNVPAEIGSVIYFDENPQLRNELQKKAMKNSRFGDSRSFRLRCDTRFPYGLPHSFGAGLFLESAFGGTGQCRGCAGGPQFRCGLDVFAYDRRGA